MSNTPLSNSSNMHVSVFRHQEYVNTQELLTLQQSVLIKIEGKGRGFEREVLSSFLHALFIFMTNVEVEMTGKNSYSKPNEVFTNHHKTYFSDKLITHAAEIKTMQNDVQYALVFTTVHDRQDILSHSLILGKHNDNELSDLIFTHNLKFKS